jgi:hypothetical protein
MLRVVRGLVLLTLLAEGVAAIRLVINTWPVTNSTEAGKKCVYITILIYQSA